MQTAQDTLVSTFFMTAVRHAFAAVRILLELGFPGNLQENRILQRFSHLEYSLEHSDGYPYCLGHPGSRITGREVRSQPQCL